MGVHESVIPAAVAATVPQEWRPSANGLFTGFYGLFWFASSIVIGFLYDHSAIGVIVFCIVLEFAAVPFLISAKHRRATA